MENLTKVASNALVDLKEVVAVCKVSLSNYGGSSVIQICLRNSDTIQVYASELTEQGKFAFRDILEVPHGKGTDLTC